MTYALILISLFAIYQWHRKRLWHKRWQLATNLHTQAAVSEMAKIWAEGYREQLRDDWPEQLDEHIH